MPAKTTNPSHELTVGNSNQLLKIFHLKVPFPFIVDVRPKYTENAVACGVNDSQPIIIPDLFENKDKIVEQMKRDGFFIKSVRQTNFDVSEICLLCDRKGVPSIIKKNTDSSYYKVSGWHTPRKKMKFKGKNQPFWLKFSHKDKPKTCWIQQWQGSKQGTFKPKTKSEQIDPRKYFISHAVKSLAI